MVGVAVLEAEANEPLSSLDRDRLLDQLVATGVVVLRGFDTTIESFESLTSSYGTRFSCDPSKKVRRRGSDTRLVPTRGYGLNPHNENTFIPGATPDLVWFHCVRPAASGGESLFCDGVELWDGLQPETKHRLSDDALVYERKFKRADWRAVYGVKHVAELTAALEGFDVDVEVSPLGSLRYTYRATQLQPTRFGAEPALRTNLLSRRPYWGVGDDEPDRFDSGGRVPRDIVDDVLTTAKQQAVEFRQLAGDVVVIDNSRVLHGRTPFDDPDRSLLVRCSWFSDDAPSSANAVAD